MIYLNNKKEIKKQIERLFGNFNSKKYLIKSDLIQKDQLFYQFYGNDFVLIFLTNY